MPQKERTKRRVSGQPRVKTTEHSHSISTCASPFFHWQKAFKTECKNEGVWRVLGTEGILEPTGERIL